jgi:transposase
VVLALCLLADLSQRVWDRQEHFCLEGSLFQLDSDLTKHSCRSRTYRKRRSNQQEVSMMSSPVAGIDPHQATFTLAIVDVNGVEITHDTFANAADGYVAAIELLTQHLVQRVAIEGSASWGSHVAIAVAAAGFDAREVPPQRAAQQRRARRLAKTDTVDAVSTARALLAEPTLGPVQALEVYDELVAKIEAVLEHRRTLVELRTLTMHLVQDQLTKLPTEIRDRLGCHGKIEARLGRLASLDIEPANVSTAAGVYRLSWLRPLAEQDRRMAAEIRRLERELGALLDAHGTTLRDEPGIGTISAATLVVEVGDPHRFATESKFARWCGTAAVALSSGEGRGHPVRHRLDFGGNRRVNSVLYIASVTQQRHHTEGRAYLERKVAEGKTRRVARRAHKRHLANRIIRRMWNDEQRRTTPLTPATP